MTAPGATRPTRGASRCFRSSPSNRASRWPGSELPYGDFNARLIASRFTYTPTTRLFVSSLIQLNIDGNSLTSSLRFRWEYRPGSDLFLVYSDGRDTVTPRDSLLNRTVAVKITRLVRF